MNDDQLEFLRQLVEATGPSGYEEETQRLWRSRVEGAAEEIRTDYLGNCIAVLNSSGSPRVMLDAHIDEIGFIVHYIDDSGYLYFATIGGFDPSTLAGERVRILGWNGPVPGVIGRKPVHLLEGEEKKKAPEVKNMWIDIGAEDRAAAEALVRVGDAGGRARGMERLQGDLVTSATLDDRVGCYVIAEVFRALAGSSSKAAVFASSSVQEEIGLRGARASAFGIGAEVGIAVEVTHATDHPNGPKTQVGDLRLGAGAVFARGANTNRRVLERLIAAAEAANKPYQIEAEPSGTGTDENVMQLTRSGMATGLVSIPLRYMHTSSEVIALQDVDSAVAIITRFVQDLDSSVNLVP